METASDIAGQDLDPVEHAVDAAGKAVELVAGAAVGRPRGERAVGDLSGGLRNGLDPADHAAAEEVADDQRQGQTHHQHGEDADGAQVFDDDPLFGQETGDRQRVAAAQHRFQGPDRVVDVGVVEDGDLRALFGEQARIPGARVAVGVAQDKKRLALFQNLEDQRIRPKRPAVDGQRVDQGVRTLAIVDLFGLFDARADLALLCPVDPRKLVSAEAPEPGNRQDDEDGAGKKHALEDRRAQDLTQGRRGHSRPPERC